MAKLYRFYLVDDDMMVKGTDNLEVALIAKRDGVTMVIEPAAGEATIDGDVEPIEPANEADYLEDNE